MAVKVCHSTPRAPFAMSLFWYFVCAFHSHLACYSLPVFKLRSRSSFISMFDSRPLLLTHPGRQALPSSIDRSRVRLASIIQDAFASSHQWKEALYPVNSLISRSVMNGSDPGIPIPPPITNPCSPVIIALSKVYCPPPPSPSTQVRTCPRRPHHSTQQSAHSSHPPWSLRP